METFLGHLKRYWKQIAGVAAFAVISVIALSVAFAAQVTIVLDSEADEPKNPLSWEKGDWEMWHATPAGIDDVDIQYLKWESSDPSVILIEGTNNDVKKLTATGAGTATITVTYNDGQGNEGTVTKQFKVKLEITSAPEKGFIFFDDTHTTDQVQTNYSTASDMTWTTSNTSVATVGQITGDTINIEWGGKGGVATITGTTPGGDQSVSIDVIARVKFNDISESIVLAASETCNVFTDYAGTNVDTVSDIFFASEDERYFIVDQNGNIHGLNAGKKNVYIYPNIDYSKYPTEAEKTPAELAAQYGDSRPIQMNFGITNGEALTATVGDTIRLNVNVAEPERSKVNWSSSNTDVATVDSNGVVTLKKSGVAAITALLVNTEINGATRHESIIFITVIDDFALNITEKTIGVGETFDLTALVTDETASVIWETSDASIASVVESEETSQKATVTGNKRGVVTITAYQEVNGVRKTATCVVNVIDSVQSVSIYPPQLSITLGDIYPLTLVFEPERPDNMEVKWVSSNEAIATVNERGQVTAVGGGDVVISVITLDGIKVASSDVHVRVPVTGITLSQTYVETSMAQRNHQLSYTILPEGDGVDRNVIWSSSNEEVLTVDQNGFVTFVSPGKATVICQTNDTGTDGVNLIATCEYYIHEPVTSVAIDFTDVTLKIGERFRLTAEVLPEDATDKSVTWYSSNTSVVTVDENGMITAVGSGSASILVQSNDSGVTAMCNVTVYQPVESISLNYSEMSVRKGTIFWLHATVNPDNSVNKTVIWSTNDPTIAQVDDSGMVTTLSPGECIITATSQDTGVFATCRVTVTEPVTGITLNYTDATIYAGERIVIIPTVTPADADNKAVTYLSSDPEVASVDENGIVTGLKGGSCVILVTTVERGLVASCRITVYEFVTSIVINEKDVKYINNGGTRTLTATVTPVSATNRGVVWSSSNTNVLRVDQRGVVRAVGLGTATITATAADGSGVFDTIVLTTITPVSTITVSPSYVTVLEGQSARVTATILPQNATIRDIEWTSSDTNIAVVDFNGEITGVSAGSCYVYATSTDGNDIVGVVRVTVKRAVPATSIVINASEVTLFPGQTRPLTVRLRPTTSTDNAMWVSSDTSVATVNQNGVVTAVGQGNAVIYCIADSGVEAECQVNVLALNSTSITLEQYDNYQLDVFGSTGNIVWYTNNNRIATVDANGKVIARGVGTTTITAKVNGKLLYCRVTVRSLK